MQCLTPIYLKERQIYVPCGKCNICRLNYIKRWLSRLSQESEFCDLTLFSTLTFDDDHYDESAISDPVKQKDILQKFLKRLRKFCHSIFSFKYFAVSELGSKTERLHFHSLFFIKSQLDKSSLILAFESLMKNAWPFGFVTNIESNTKVISYLLKYELKDIGKKYSVRLISKGISLDFANSLSQYDLLHYDIFHSYNRSYKLNRYLLNKIYPHGKFRSENENETWDVFKFDKGISSSPVYPPNVYKDLCNKFLPNLYYDTKLNEFCVRVFDSTDSFCRSSYLVDDKLVVPFYDIVNYFNSNILLTKRSKL